MKGNEIRRKFLEYFESAGHQIVRSSSLVPQDDPTLLFTNAGMVQFKRTFLGEEKRNYNRATTSQKCVRAGGKHNDLDNVGYTARHHTFFEMLGNFSFGDYFKEQAIAHAWELLVDGYQLPAEKLWISVYLDDDEAYDIWHQQVGVPEERIVRLGEEDNFWSMGDTGPCGPCSEIMIDRGEKYGCDRPDCAVGCECDRYLEIWNLVFMQFNRDADGTMTPLPKPSIDTGMGLERLASVLQNTDTNYETDLLYPIMQKAEQLSGYRIGQSDASDVAMKVIADHSRSAAFLIGDGVLPSNEGRGYVLRRIMRRAIRYGRQIGLNQPFLHETARVVFDIMQPAYPELGEAAAYITNVIQNEEQRFSETLDNGLRLLQEGLEDLRRQARREVPGELIFKLYDTFGFPVDIVQDVVRDEGLGLDMDGFEAAMAQQKAQSRSVTAFAEVSEAFKELTASGFLSDFTGYERIEDESEVVLLVAQGNAVENAPAGSQIEMVAQKTPFYAASGGQVGDVGTVSGDGFAIEITGTEKDPTGLIIHKGTVSEGVVAKNAAIELRVDTEKRMATARNHTATHILHAALRNILGDHVKQAGSMVAPDRLRFDFTHFAAVETATIEKIERQVNQRVRENVAVSIEQMDLEAAMQSGATALFEEKYGDRVRVISLAEYSQELCGGTHCQRTGDVGFFKIISESSVAAGVRRIEAVTGAAAIAFEQDQAGIVIDISRLLKEKPEGLIDRIQRMQAAHKGLEKELEKMNAAMAELSAAQATEQIRSVNGIQVLAERVDAESAGALRDMADKYRDKIGSGVVVLGSAAGGKALITVMVTKDLVGRCHAGKLVKEISAVVGGGGGGRPDMAQAGGPQAEKLDSALESAYAAVEKCG